VRSEAVGTPAGVHHDPGLSTTVIPLLLLTMAYQMNVVMTLWSVLYVGLRRRFAAARFGQVLRYAVVSLHSALLVGEVVSLLALANNRSSVYALVVVSIALASGLIIVSAGISVRVLGQIEALEKALAVIDREMALSTDTDLRRPTAPSLPT
jgi:hypothetical protein